MMNAVYTIEGQDEHLRVASIDLLGPLKVEVEYAQKDGKPVRYMFCQGAVLKKIPEAHLQAIRRLLPQLEDQLFKKEEMHFRNALGDWLKRKN